ncbi:MAG TPA: potassium channel family protein [Modicisalibacter sp.]|nr:potassium channel family protein [Modicisalibacter sp.]
MIGNPMVGIIGVVLILAVIYDATQTILSASKSGPLTNRLASLVWKSLLRYHRWRHSHWLLSTAGPWSAILLVLFWFLLAWAGWFLLFCSSHQAVVNSTTSAAATLLERAYYTGYTITTLGYGDFVPGDADWRIPSVLAAANGFFLFTLSITYIVNIQSAVTQKRQLALCVSALGQSPYQIISSSADGGSFESLSSQLQQIQSTINSSGQQHLAFPILHYFHGEHSDNALPLALTRLYQTLALICFACPGLSSPTRSQLVIAQHTIDQFLETLGSAFIRPTREMPEMPNLDDYAALPGFDKSPSDMHAYLRSLEHQRLLHAYVRKDGWEWHDVWEPISTGAA